MSGDLSIEAWGDIATKADHWAQTRSESGVVRSVDIGKPDYTLIDTALLERWARLMTAQVPSKGRDNWRNASTDEDLLRFRQSAWRHFLAWQSGETDEDHAAALLFNVAGAELARSVLLSREKA